MPTEWVSAGSGIIGALIGGACTLAGVQYAEVQKRKSALLLNLVQQRSDLRSGKIKSLNDTREEQFSGILKAFIDYRTALLITELRERASREWRRYKGNSDGYLPIFSEYTIIKHDCYRVETLSRPPNYEESMARLNRFIEYLDNSDAL